MKSRAEWRRKALFGHIEAMRLAGQPIPDPSTLGDVMPHDDYPDSLAVLPVEAAVGS